MEPTLCKEAQKSALQWGSQGLIWGPEEVQRGPLRATDFCKDQVTHEGLSEGDDEGVGKTPG